MKSLNNSIQDPVSLGPNNLNTATASNNIDDLNGRVTGEPRRARSSRIEPNKLSPEPHLTQREQVLTGHNYHPPTILDIDIRWSFLAVEYQAMAVLVLGLGHFVRVVKFG
uniref:Uncharacterized protein n=1 Tax=Opuntia streptacantha TaxID=393608 RepID=A0A7C9DKU6_OPUST